MSNRYTDKYIYAVDKNNGLYCLAMRYFASLANAYYSVTCVKDRHYEVFSIVDDCYEITGEKIDIPEVKDWQDMLNGCSNSKAMNLIALHKLNPNCITDIITVSVTGSHRGPYDYHAQVICQNSVHDVDGIVDKLFGEDESEQDDKWYLSANIVANKILNDIECFR